MISYYPVFTNSEFKLYKQIESLVTLPFTTYKTLLREKNENIKKARRTAVPNSHRIEILY